MKISVIGSGYVGLCTGIGFAIKGHDVTCIDIDQQKVKAINGGKIPFYEKGLQENVRKYLRKKTFLVENEVKIGEKSDVIFICVGTPSDKNGGIDLSYVMEATKQVGSCLVGTDSYCVVAIKSTVVPGTTEKDIIPILEKFSGKKVGEFGVCSNPEFLREGRALEDFLRPDYIVIGEYDKKSGNVLKKLYRGFRSPVIRTDIKTAEMVKYASNAFLATKISFINEIGNICKKHGINVYDVADSIGKDKRIGRLFLDAGCGFGGSCFSKDVSALINSTDYEPKLLKEVLSLNINQRKRIIGMLKEKLPLENKRIAILGLAFKPDTDDVRDSVSVDVIKYLGAEGAQVIAYDPKAMENMKKIYPEIDYADNVAEALKNADACIILTEWDEFKKLKDKDFSPMKTSVIIEGRRTLKNITGSEGICW